jgi:ABC-2 type transport system ATP-binding protein
VDGISFAVHTGEVLGFLGPNGAGKTTTMKMICGLVMPDGGSVSVGGIPVADDPWSVRQRIGYLPEHNPLYLDMPVIDFLRFNARLQHVPEGDIPERLARMVTDCGLDAEKHKRIGELSKGYRQRVGLAQAMVHDPQVLILDEPTTGLDPNQIVEIRELIRRLGRERTVIFSTHILPEVEAICDRILIIHQGRIAADAAPEELRRQARGQDMLTVGLVDVPASEAMAAFSALPMVTTVEDAGAGGRYRLSCTPGSQAAEVVYRLCVARQWTLNELHTREARLEEVFRGLTTA